MNWKCCLLSVAVLAMSWSTTTAQENPQGLNLAAADGRVVVVFDSDGESIALGKFWIGVSVGEVPESLRAHLKLDDGVGVLALDVVDKGPAQAAGIEKHDILLKAGEQALKSAKDLLSAVNQSETKELTLELLHKGEKKTITVKPQERPANQAKSAIWNEDLFRTYGPLIGRKNLPGLNQEGFIVVQPGVQALAMPQPNGGKLTGQHGLRMMTIPPHVMPQPRLPNGVSVSITRTNNDPAKITVKRGDESWDVTEKELDKLPADLRPHVSAMLGWQRGPAFELPVWESIVPTTQQPNGTPYSQTVRQPRNALDEPVKKSDLLQLEEMIKELSKKLDALGQKE